MGVYDAVTGFMKGYSDTEGNTGDKIFAGVREGLAKVIENMIGLPLDLLKSGLTWLIKTFFGESEVTAALEGFSFKETIGDMVRLPFDLIKGAYNWIKGLFVDPAAALEELWTGIVGDGGLIDLLFTPIDKALKESEQDGETFARFIADENYVFEPTAIYNKEELNLTQLAVISDCLTDEERKIIKFRFGLFGHEKKTLQELSDIIGKTRERIRQIETKALKKLKKELAKKGVEK